MIVGNKVDKETFSRQVSTQEGEAYARRMGAVFVGEWRPKAHAVPCRVDAHAGG